MIRGDARDLTQHQLMLDAIRKMPGDQIWFVESRALGPHEYQIEGAILWAGPELYDDLGKAFSGDPLLEEGTFFTAAEGITSRN
jgi:hypothetical protein